MKSKLLVWSILGLTACGGANPSDFIEKGSCDQTYFEHQLGAALPGVDHDDTVILHLEAGAPHAGDTGVTGVDVVRYVFDHPVRQTVCVEDHAEVVYALTIRDESGQMVAEVTSGNCVTLDIEPGSYAFELFPSATSALAMAGGAPVFIRPIAETTHCEDFEGMSLAGSPDALPEAVPTGPCIEGLNLSCKIPEHYWQLPYNCGYGGPWQTSDFGVCASMDSDEAAQCADHLYQQCDALEALCLERWAGPDGDFADIGTSEEDVWVSCFGGRQIMYSLNRNDERINPVVHAWFPRYVEQFCADVARDCTTGWRQDTPAPADCPGFVEFVRFGDLELGVGQVAIHQRTYLHVGRNVLKPGDDDIMLVLDGRCDHVSHRVGMYLLGPHTQAVVYPFEGMKGKPLLLDNGGGAVVRQFPVPTGKRSIMGAQDPTYRSLLASTASSIAVLPVNGTADDDCRVQDVGVVCDQSTTWDMVPRTAGETVLVGMPDDMIDVGSNCASAVLFDHRCDDLAKLGLANRGGDVTGGQALSRVILADSDTVLRAFADEGFSGPVLVSQGQSFVPSSVALEAATIRSAQAYRLPGYNHTILVSLRKCCGCDLEDVAFVGDDLTHTVLVGANLDGARFEDVDLTGADLRRTSLRNATFSKVRMGGNWFGCAVMTGVSMVSPSDAAASAVTVGQESNWDIDGTFNHIPIACDAVTTDLSNARVPIQLLPRNTWSAINLQGTTLLDKTDHYDLAGIDLRNGRFAGLRAGGKALDMRGADLSGADLTKADFSSVDFSPLVKGGQARYANFSHVRIGGASFANANLEGADFVSVTIDNGVGRVNFAYSLLINAVFQDADLGDADFAYAYLFSKSRGSVATQKKARVENLTGQGSVFTGAFLSNMTLSNVRFIGANFNGAQLVGTQFSSGDLSKTRFSDAYLQGADLSAAVVTNASFAGANLSLASGYWHYSSDDPECTDIRINYEATRLGDTTNVTCPNGELGPCDTNAKLTPKGRPINEPPCVDGDDDIFGNTDCITHEYLKNNTIPECNESQDDVMQCGCLVSQ